MDEKITITAAVGLSQAVLMHDMLSQQLMFDKHSGKLKCEDALAQGKAILELEEFICRKLSLQTMGDMKVARSNWRQESYKAHQSTGHFRALIDHDTRRYEDNWPTVAEKGLRLVSDNPTDTL